MIRYDYFDNDSTIIVIYSGKITKEDIKGFIKHAYKPTLQRSLSDFSGSTGELTEDDTEEIAKYWEIFLTQHLQSVLLVDGTRSTALSYLFALYQNKLLTTKVCSTLEGCIASIKLGITAEVLKDRLQKLTLVYQGN